MGRELAQASAGCLCAGGTPPICNSGSCSTHIAATKAAPTVTAPIFWQKLRSKRQPTWIGLVESHRPQRRCELSYQSIALDAAVRIPLAILGCSCSLSLSRSLTTEPSVCNGWKADAPPLEF